MARFLDPGMFEAEVDLPPPERLTPLEFIMREAIAQPRPSGALPLAFVNADLAPSSPWRSKLGAAERLVRSQALSENILFDLYTERQAAASGGIWNRVEAIQAFDVALLAGNRKAIAASLPVAYQAMQEVALEVPFARRYGDRLAMFDLDGPARTTAFRVAMLSDGFEDAAARFSPEDPRDIFVRGLAAGAIGGLEPPGNLGSAISRAFLQPMPEGPLRDLLAAGQLGEAILRAMLLLKGEAFGDPGDITAALSVFRAVGLEYEARRIAIQLLLLERRG
ncbi:MAG: hypothetical protein KDK00_07095, partial [Rhodobacteraceae bacterium]|nr:hypothetical protein [Paracoccaceae bacterium]